MANKTKRKVLSKFWAAMSHTIGVGIFGIIFGIIFAVLIDMLFSGVITLFGLSQKLEEELLLQMVLLQCSSVMALAAATYYSMSRIRKYWIMYDPLSYIRPCIIAGRIVTLVALPVPLLYLARINPQQHIEALVIGSYIFYFVHYLVYAAATRRVLKNMTPDVCPKQQPVVASE